MAGNLKMHQHFLLLVFFYLGLGTFILSNLFSSNEHAQSGKIVLKITFTFLLNNVRLKSSTSLLLAFTDGV